MRSSEEEEEALLLGLLLLLLFGLGREGKASHRTTGSVAVGSPPLIFGGLFAASA